MDQLLSKSWSGWGYLSVAGDKYPVVVLNEKCMDIIDNTTEIRLTKPADVPVVTTQKADDRYDTGCSSY